VGYAQTCWPVYPLTFYFIIAFGGTSIVWSLFVLSQDGAGLLPFRSSTSFMVIMFLGQVFGPVSSYATIIAINRHSAKQERDIGVILPFSQNSIVNRRSARTGGES
jgi:hypothetical protein